MLPIWPKAALRTRVTAPICCVRSDRRRTGSRYDPLARAGPRARTLGLLRASGQRFTGASTASAGVQRRRDRIAIVGPQVQHGAPRLAIGTREQGEGAVTLARRFADRARALLLSPDGRQQVERPRRQRIQLTQRQRCVSLHHAPALPDHRHNGRHVHRDRSVTRLLPEVLQSVVGDQSVRHESVSAPHQPVPRLAQLAGERGHVNLRQRSRAPPHMRVVQRPRVQLQPVKLIEVELPPYLNDFRPERAHGRQRSEHQRHRATHVRPDRDHVLIAHRCDGFCKLRIGERCGMRFSRFGVFLDAFQVSPGPLRSFSPSFSSIAGRPQPRASCH